MDTDHIRTIVGIIGNVISFFLFASPAPTFFGILKKKATEEFHPYPYLACVMNCLFWIFYGLPIVHPHSVLVITINGIGLLMELIYLTIFFIYTNRKYRKHILLVLLAEACFVGVIAVITMLLFHTHERRSMFVGIICIIFGIIMYGAPLSIMKKVIQTKSVKYMPFWLSLAGFANGLIWLVYALLKFDLYILVANGTGALLGFCQLALYAFYYFFGVKDDDDQKPSEVQLEEGLRKLPVSTLI